MTSIITFLAYKDRAEEAAKLYCSLFPNSRIKSITRYPDVPVAPSPGAVMTVEFELDGTTYVAMNGGDHFKLTDAVSLTVQCDTQEEIDRYWSKLTADGGEPGPCGWCKDKFGLSWQIQPRAMSQWVSEPVRAKRVFEAFMKMSKLDLATLERAAAG